jgi:DNA-binding CsgD family transcriptional regulator
MEAAAVPRTPLLERSEELARIETALARARAGGGAFLVVEGPAGIGKTAVLSAARTLAVGQDMRVLRSRGAELERDFAFGVVRQLFEPVLAEASVADRADWLQGAAGVAAGLLDLPGGERTGGMAAGFDPSFAILHGLYWLCANLASQRTLCLVVDDAHWADGPSLRYLAFLLTRLEELSVALVVASRPRESGAEADLIATITADPSAEIVRLAPLTRAAVEHLVETAFGSRPDPVFTETCLRATRGTPFLLRALVEALTEEGITPDAAAAPRVERIGARTIGRSLHLRLARLPEPAGRLARAVAVLERGELTQAARLAGLEGGEAAEAADVLAAAGILEPGRPLAFVHPIVRTGIYTELPSGERSKGHRGAAQLLAAQQGASELVAEHLLVSDPAHDAWVVERLVEAARTAARSGAPESAAVYLRRALREPPAPDLQPGLLLELGMAGASAGLADWPHDLQASVEAATDEASAAAGSMVLALALSRAQRPGDAVEVLDRALSALDERHERLALLLEAAAVGAGMNGAVTAPIVAARREALRERATRDLSAPPELLAVSAFISILTNEPADVGARLALRALDAAPPARDVDDRPWFSFATWFSQVTVSLIWAECYDTVRPLLDVSIAEARATGDSSRLAVGLAHRGWLALRLGDLGAAETDTRTALAAAELPAPAMYRVLNGGVLVKALVDQGQLAEAERALAPLDAEADVATLTAAVLRLSRGRLRVEQGRVAEGLADFLGVGALATRTYVTCPSYLPWRSEAALAHLALGDQPAAQHLAQEELELARTFGAPRALGVAQTAAGVVAGGDAGEALLREAVETLGAVGAKLDRARALTDFGALLRRRNRRSQARELLREALDAAHRAGAAPLAQRAETELRATGARPRRVVLSGVESLTASERRVAELATQDLTNREIAQVLFVTARTVEGHLTSVFRKLQLGSRDQLAAALAGDAASERASS